MGDLARGRLVGRRDAAHRVGDHAIGQSERLRVRGIVSPAGKPDLEQSAIEQLAGIVTEEGTPGAIGTLQSRGEPDDQQLG